MMDNSQIYKEGNNFDILLIMPPPWGIEVPPLSIACLSSYLKGKDIKVDNFDFNIELYSAVPDNYKYLWDMNCAEWWSNEKKYLLIREKLNKYIEPIIEKILSHPHKIIGFSVSSNCPDLILTETVQRIKKRDSEKIIILGGVSISIKTQRDELLKMTKSYVDYCIVGEGEEALYKLVKSVSANKITEAGKLKGVLTKERFYEDVQKAEVKDWDKCPFPRFEDFDLQKYRTHGASLPMEFSRGCIGNCGFCPFNVIFGNYKFKKPEYTIEQIRFYRKEYNINHLSVVDSTVNGDINKLEQLCHLLIENNFPVRINAQLIPRKEMTYELLSKMKKANFYRLEYGLESGSDNVLKRMRKIFNAETAERAIRDTHKAGIETYIYLIVGYPGETEEDLNETKKFLKRNAKYINMLKSINPLYIVAGSEIFNNPAKYNIVLPKVDFGKKWCIKNENTYEIRKKRILELKLLAKDFAIPFTEETELFEFTLASLNKKADLKISTSAKRRSIYKWLTLILVSFYTFFYIAYFWLYMILRKKVLLGAKKE